MKDGYLNDVLDVLDAHDHPCVLIGRYALLWMGAQVVQDSVSTKSGFFCSVQYKVADIHDSPTSHDKCDSLQERKFPSNLQ